ncbi:unnamed protein product [Notodromas monacha]|uniref:Calpain catalytic domain-containing protein n=1 Tax=Notodromas monacha TaxID=399045 RepID=A0A7R9C1T0_9CRUS|nr:unnamed protein product [Notodromas monacha]CAG0924576.1 unnamed protein product [Notodromas monacha]
MFSRRMLLRHADQDFLVIKNAILSRTRLQGDLYEDRAFPVRVKDAACSFPSAIWKHFKEVIGEDPVCIHQRDSVTTFIRGALDIPWLIVLGTLIASSSDILQKIFPDLNGHATGCEQSIFRVHLWKWGKWHEIVLDGRVPVDSTSNTILLTRSKINNEIWPTLLEKAFAKLFGGFEILTRLTLPDALVACTGGVLYFTDLRTETFLADASSERMLYRRIRRELRNNALICCRIPVANAQSSSVGSASSSTNMPFGLLKGHFFTVLDARTIPMLSLRGIIRGSGLRDKLMVLRLCDPLHEQSTQNLRGSRRRGSHSLQKSRTASALLPAASPGAILEHSLSFPNACTLPREGSRSEAGYNAKYNVSHPFSARLMPDEVFNLGLAEPQTNAFDAEARASGQEGWLRMQDFIRFFIDVVICTNCSPSVASSVTRKMRRRGSGRWRKEERVKGSWTLGDTGSWLDRSGGGPHCDTFLNNPQVSLAVFVRQCRITVGVMCEGKSCRSWAAKMPQDAANNPQLFWNLVGFDSVFYRKSLTSKILLEVHKKGLLVPVLLGRCEITASDVTQTHEAGEERIFNLTNTRRFRDIRDEDFHFLPDTLEVERRLSVYSICVSLKTVANFKDL